MSAPVLLLSLALVVLVHHLGHRLTAKVLGLNVDLSLQDCCAPKEPATFGRTALGKRLALALGGTVASYLLAVVPLTLILLSPRQVPSLTIEEVPATFPAAEAGVQPGDTIEAVDGAAVSDFAALRDRVAKNPEPVRLRLRRGTEVIDLELKPRAGPEGSPVIGIVPRKTVQQPSLGAAFAGAHRAPLRVLERLVLGTVETEAVGGPVMIAISASESSWSTWLSAIFGSIAIYSWIFGAMHLLPLPGLDGWLLVLGLRELATKKQPDYAWHQRARRKALLVFAAAVLLAIALVLKNDVARVLR